MLNNKNISFSNAGYFPEEMLLYPVPAINKLPDWYKGIEPHKKGFPKKYITENSEHTFTVKKCLPLRDSLGLGYMIFLNADIQVTKGVTSIINWVMPLPTIVAQHSLDQIEGFEIGDEYGSNPFKWINGVVINTPKGYSTLFSHPLNRTDLPFYTLSGVVDTDKYNSSIHFPFFIKKDFEGVIKRGTPIAQFFPFKRDDWNSSKKEFNSQQDDLMVRAIFSKYKKHDWVRKSFK